MNLMKIKGARAEKGLTQEEVARMIGISTSSYIAKENGKKEFKITELISLSQCLEKPVEIFLKSN